MKVRTTHLLCAGVSALLVLLADRVTKYVALTYFVDEYAVNQFISFQLVFNRGISWSLFHDASFLINVGMQLAILLLLGMLGLFTYNRYKQGESIFIESAVAAAAVSNLLDRYMYNGVIDFIELHYKSYYWPSFNIADIVIVCGIFWMMYHYAE